MASLCESTSPLPSLPIKDMSSDSDLFGRCFWINLPFGGVVLAIVIFFARIPRRKQSDLTWRKKLKELDFVGATLLISALVCLLLALQWGGIVYSWGKSKVWGCLIGFGLILPLFVAYQIYLGDR